MLLNLYWVIDIVRLMKLLRLMKIVFTRFSKYKLEIITNQSEQYTLKYAYIKKMNKNQNITT